MIFFKKIMSAIIISCFISNTSYISNTYGTCLAAVVPPTNEVEGDQGRGLRANYDSYSDRIVRLSLISLLAYVGLAKGVSSLLATYNKWSDSSLAKEAARYAAFDNIKKGAAKQFGKVKKNIFNGLFSAGIGSEDLGKIFDAAKKAGYSFDQSLVDGVIKEYSTFKMQILSSPGGFQVITTPRKTLGGYSTELEGKVLEEFLAELERYNGKIGTLVNNNFYNRAAVLSEEVNFPRIQQFVQKIAGIEGAQGEVFLESMADTLDAQLKRINTQFKGITVGEYERLMTTTQDGFDTILSVAKKHPNATYLEIIEEIKTTSPELASRFETFIKYHKPANGEAVVDYVMGLKGTYSEANTKVGREMFSIFQEYYGCENASKVTMTSYLEKFREFFRNKPLVHFMNTTATEDLEYLDDLVKLTRGKAYNALLSLQKNNVSLIEVMKKLTLSVDDVTRLSTEQSQLLKQFRQIFATREGETIGQYFSRIERFCNNSHNMKAGQAFTRAAIFNEAVAKATVKDFRGSIWYSILNIKKVFGFGSGKACVKRVLFVVAIVAAVVWVTEFYKANKRAQSKTMNTNDFEAFDDNNVVSTDAAVRDALNKLVETMDKVNKRLLEMALAGFKATSLKGYLNFNIINSEGEEVNEGLDGNAEIELIAFIEAAMSDHISMLVGKTVSQPEDYFEFSKAVYEDVLTGVLNSGRYSSITSKDQIVIDVDNVGVHAEEIAKIFIKDNEALFSTKDENKTEGNKNI